MLPHAAVITQELVPVRKTFRASEPGLPVLIQVPALRPRMRRPVRRRRLRREVRLGAILVLLVVPLIAFGMIVPHRFAEDRGTPEVTAPDVILRPPVVSLLPTLEVEPAATRDSSMGSTAARDENWVEAWSVDDEEAPAARPAGYLLPDLPVLEDRDGGKESAHAGS